MALPTPYIYRDPSLTMRLTVPGTDPFVELKCFYRSVGLNPDQEIVDVPTTCNPRGQQPGLVQWTITFDLQLSFGALADPDTVGSWNVLRQWSGLQVDFILLPKDDTAISESNPAATGVAWAPVIPFTLGEVGQPSYFEVAFNVIGEPVFDTTP